MGALGEDLAPRHMQARGFELLEANFRTRHGELDLVAADDRCLVFCEVKLGWWRAGLLPQVPLSAADPLGPFAAIGPLKRRQVRLMAREWQLYAGRIGPGAPSFASTPSDGTDPAEG